MCYILLYIYFLSLKLTQDVHESPRLYIMQVLLLRLSQCQKWMEDNSGNTAALNSRSYMKFCFESKSVIAQIRHRGRWVYIFLPLIFLSYDISLDSVVAWVKWFWRRNLGLLWKWKLLYLTDNMSVSNRDAMQGRILWQGTDKRSARTTGN